MADGDSWRPASAREMGRYEDRIIKHCSYQVLVPVRPTPQHIETSGSTPVLPTSYFAPGTRMGGSIKTPVRTWDCTLLDGPIGEKRLVFLERDAKFAARTTGRVT